MNDEQFRGAIAGIPLMSEREARLLAESPEVIEQEIRARIDAWRAKQPRSKVQIRQRGRASLLDQYRHLFPTKSNEELAVIAGCTKANVRAYRIKWFKQPVRKNKSYVKNKTPSVQVALVQVESGRVYAYIMPDCPGVVFTANSAQEAVVKAKSYLSINPIPIGIFHV